MKEIMRRLHLWLGLLSGIVVFIVCVTGCLYVFKDEIQSATQPWKRVEVRQVPLVKPSLALQRAVAMTRDTLPSALTIGVEGDALEVDYADWMAGTSTSIFLNPYSGQVIKTVRKDKDDFDFFSFVLRGHRSLWLPREIGRGLVDYGVLLFFVTLVTGVVIWLPRRWNRNTWRQKLTFHRPLKWARFNFDMHNVLGMYLLVPLAVLCFTGLMMGPSWFSRGVYSLVSGGDTLKAYTLPKADTSLTHTHRWQKIDTLHARLQREEARAVQFYYALPQTKDGVVRVSVVHERGSYYRTDNRFFDPATLKELQGTGPYAGKYTQVGAADAMMRMNLSIHDGRIWGIWGKILMFVASLTGASLPVTGFVIWWRKRKRK
uniref:PepSY-associated TM helix domain-containing protein n=2 Tax=unclassified Prevotella TaxID=2638335 RepID=A0AB33J8K3_9BACT